MAKNINHIQHIKSSVVEDGKPKLPSSSVLVEGEIAVNFAKDVETLSIKNASGEVVTFSSDNYYTEKKLGSGFTGDNSGKTVTEVIDENEQVTAAALNDLNERKMDASAYTPTDLTGYATEEWVGGRLGSGFTDEFSARTVTEVIEKNEKVVAASLNDLNTRKLDASAYTPTDLTGYATETWVGDRLGSGFTGTNSATTVTEGIEGLEAWIEDKLGSAFTGSNSGVTVTKYIEDDEEAISAALNDLNERKMDASAYTPTDLTGYATEEWVNDTLEDKLGSGFTGENSANTVTSVIEDNEEAISSALNDLNERKMDLSAYTPTDLTGYATEEWVGGRLGSGFTGENSAMTVTKYVEECEKVTAAALNDLETRKLDASAYTEGMTDYYLKSETSGATELDAAFSGKADVTWVEEKIGSAFTGANSGVTITEYIEENEEITAAALNDLNERKMDASAYTPTDLTGYATEEWVNETLGDKLGSGFTGENSANTVTSVIRDNELVIASALNDLNDRKMDASAYTEAMGDYYLKSETSGATEIDAALADKVGVSWIEDKLGSGFTGENSANTVTGIIEENEEITSAALNDLDGRISSVEDSVSSHTSNTDIHVTQSDKTLWNGISTKESRMPIETVATGTTALTAVVGTYYTLSNVGTINITLPVPTDGYVNTIVFYIVTGSANPTISMASTAPIKYQENYNFDASSTYEVNALYNGIAWVIAFMKLS